VEPAVRCDPDVMEISSVSISFGPGASPAPEPDGRRFRVKHALRSLEAGETHWTCIDHVGVDADAHARRASLMETLASADFAIEAAAAVLKAADEKRQAAIAGVMNGS
jgi:N-acetyl-anhydromuramyl-L-alanine amidase AmpD